MNSHSVRAAQAGSGPPLASESVKSAVKFEQVPCPVCGAAERSPFLTTVDRFQPHGRKFELVQCSQCRFIYVNPRPVQDAIWIFYQDSDYQPFLSTQESRGWWDKLYNLARNFTVPGKRRTVERLHNKGKLLDVGCGTGEFLHEMQQHGWHVAGIETDKNAADFATSNFGLEVRNSDLFAADFSPQSFDVITLWHVLEHVHEPANVLQHLAGLLKDDGHLLLAMPNVTSFDARFYRENWVPLDSPRHLSHFAPENVRQLCQTCGFELVRFQQMVIDVFYNCMMSEKYLSEQRRPGGVRTFLQMTRAVLIATTSAVLASRIRAQERRLGSSVLYFIKKGKSQ